MKQHGGHTLSDNFETAILFSASSGVAPCRLLERMHFADEKLHPCFILSAPFLEVGYLSVVTQVHVVGLRSLRVWDSFVNSVQQFVFDLSDCVAVQHLHWHLSPNFTLRGDAHQRLRRRERKQRLICLHQTLLSCCLCVYHSVVTARKTSLAVKLDIFNHTHTHTHTVFSRTPTDLTCPPHTHTHTRPLHNL